MSRKDYVAMAAAIHAQWDAEVEAAKLRGDSMDGVFAVEALTFRIAEVFAAENENFDRQRFIAAALGEPSAVAG